MSADRPSRVRLTQKRVRTTAFYVLWALGAWIAYCLASGLRRGTVIWIGAVLFTAFVLGPVRLLLLMIVRGIRFLYSATRRLINAILHWYRSLPEK